MLSCARDRQRLRPSMGARHVAGRPLAVAGRPNPCREPPSGVSPPARTVDGARRRECVGPLPLPTPYEPRVETLHDSAGKEG